MGHTGLEPGGVRPCLAGYLAATPIYDGAQSGASGAGEGSMEPELAAVVEVWATLPVAVRERIVKLVEASGAATGEGSREEVGR